MARSRIDKKTHSVSAPVGDQTYEQLVALCQAEDTSIARIIRRALGEFLEGRSGGLDADLTAARRQRL
jgi:hypothetical protein